MNRKRMVAAGVGAGLFGATLVATPALAANGIPVVGNLKNTGDRHTWYGAKWVATADNAVMFINKVDGPEILVTWWDCVNHNSHGPWATLPDNDNHGPVLVMKGGMKKGQQFCLAAVDHGGNATDTWSGFVTGNVARA